MKTPEEIEKIAETMGIKVKANVKSFKELHKYLDNDEKVVSIVDANTSLAVITNKKVLGITTSLLSPPDAKEIPLKNVSNIEIDAGFMYTDLKVIAIGQVLKISFPKKDHAIAFKNKINETIQENQPSQSNSGTSDIATQLEKLAKLKEQGILTESEFATQKAKLLNM